MYEERIFADNINNYDMILLYIRNSQTSEIFCPTIIDKSDFNKEIVYYSGGFSDTSSECAGIVKIDTQNNKISWMDRNNAKQIITKVIGIKL